MGCVRAQRESALEADDRGRRVAGRQRAIADLHQRRGGLRAGREIRLANDGIDRFAELSAGEADGPQAPERRGKQRVEFDGGAIDLGGASRVAQALFDRLTQSEQQAGSLARRSGRSAGCEVRFVERNQLGPLGGEKECFLERVERGAIARIRFETLARHGPKPFPAESLEWLELGVTVLSRAAGAQLVGP
ncbi:MAG: hypothetical protein NTZ61_00600, partial [Proteobacteria bacterium]|nr:hypothetical protein [Pseudomonadota bacterium]